MKKMESFCFLHEVQLSSTTSWHTVFFLVQFYSSKNTIMFDDLRRNFMMNLQNGLVIKPFRKAHANRDNDQELVKLTHYLLAIADLDDLSVLDHKMWEFFADELSDVPEWCNEFWNLKVCCLCLPFEVGSLCFVFSYHLCQTSLVIAAKTLSLTLTEIHQKRGGGGCIEPKCRYLLHFMANY